MLRKYALSSGHWDANQVHAWHTYAHTYTKTLHVGYHITSFSHCKLERCAPSTWSSRIRRGGNATRQFPVFAVFTVLGSGRGEQIEEERTSLSEEF